MPEPGAVRDEAQRRRRRTDAYCSMWALPSVDGQVPVVLDSERGARSPDLVRERIMCLCVVALKGQGLSQHEVFAIADSWHLWAHLTLEENDFVLDPDPDQQSLVNHAWRFEGIAVLTWALGLVRHLPFPDKPVDSGAITEVVVRKVVKGDVMPRPRSEVLDAADIALRCRVLADAAAAPGLHVGIVHERNVAFDWLLPKFPVPPSAG